MISRYHSYDALKVEWAAPSVLKVSFNRPEKRNAMNDAVHRQISEIWLDIDADEEVRSVLVCGEGSDFCVGGEVDLVVGMLEDRVQRRRTMQEALRLVHNMVNCSKPIVSAIQGSAIGGGLAVALLADISVAAKDARLLDGHVRIGLAAGDHAVLVWPLLCGLAKAKYHVMMNEAVSGTEAERIGLVSRVVESSELESKSLRIAERLSELPAPAIRWTKYAFNNWLRAAAPHFDLSHSFETMSFETDDAVQSIKLLKNL
ncbi:MAG: enoyl-CoA hydratase/isomerase family protein [Novosphingobium sp.]|nr:enoyl-CoA hydratase/isomerase family protein [Novosphingobium sp.]